MDATTMMDSNLSRTMSRRDRPKKQLTDSQRALELRKFFAPSDLSLAPEDSVGFNSSLDSDGALGAFAETVVWRLRAVRAMVSLIDRETQYFIAGALRSTDTTNFGISHDSQMFGESKSTLNALCQHTLGIDNTVKDEETNQNYSCFIIEDLREDPRFGGLGIVDGSIASYRFYAGTPITTENGVNIGTFFLYDDEPRLGGLNVAEKRSMVEGARNVMRHLETKREAAERRRISLMSQGIATFLEKTSKEIDLLHPGTDVLSDAKPLSKQFEPAKSIPVSAVSPSIDDAEVDKRKNSENTLDKIKVTLDHAANILRESLELTVGGVVFLDASSRYLREDDSDAYEDTGTLLGQQLEKFENSDDEPKGPILPGANQPIAYTSDQLSTVSPMTKGGNERRTAVRPSKVLAMSAAKVTEWKSSSSNLDGKTVQTLINSYPKGNVWYIDDEGYFSSLEQTNGETSPDEVDSNGSSGRRSSFSRSVDSSKQQAEASLLTKTFRKARQIIFLPLWDAGAERWHSCCFVWSQSAVPVFTVESEISYLSAFTNSVMVEISRLDAITANKLKSNFISSISHEFRSPLHGILASAEFLRESNLNEMQYEFMSTIQSCGSTLLDTINHVLDYSKINSFETSGGEQGALSNELYQITNIALLCEEIVNGVIAAREFRGMTDSHTPTERPSTPKDHVGTGEGEKRGEWMADVRGREGLDGGRLVEFVMDFEARDWDFKVQPGALRRVVMNLFGNSCKYTARGFILVRLRMEDVPGSKDPGEKMLVLNIIDTGKGMSSDYLERRLFTPFSQEDPFASGVGLGLSIVWSIVTQLGGKIQVHSEAGHGTDVEVRLPINSSEYNLNTASEKERIDIATGAKEARQCLASLKSLASTKTVVIRRADSSSNLGRSKTMAWDSLEKYCSEWFGFKTVSSLENKDMKMADLVIMERNSHEDTVASFMPGETPKSVLLVHDEASYPAERSSTGIGKFRGVIRAPVGPYKLARSILALLQGESGRYVRPTMASRSHSDCATQTSSFSSRRSSPERQFYSHPTLTGSKETSSFVPLGKKENPRMPKSSMKTLRSSGTGSEADAQELDQALRRAQALSFALPNNISVASEANAMELQAERPAITPQDSFGRDSDGKMKAPPHPEPLYILAVDDNALNLQLLKRFLMKRKMDLITTACDGLQAVNAVKHKRLNSRRQMGFDVIFMDITMPEMDGFEATRLIREFETQQELSGGIGDLDTSNEPGEKQIGDTITEKVGIATHIRGGSGGSNASCNDSSSSLSRQPINRQESGDTITQNDLTSKTGFSRTEKQKAAYIVALTGLASRKDRDKAVDCGFDDFMTKPITFVKLGDMLERLAREKAGCVEVLGDGCEDCERC